MGLSTEGGPVVSLVEFSRTLERTTKSAYSPPISNALPVSSADDTRALYDYFMRVCGPVSGKFQTLAADGAISMIGEDGALISVAPPASQTDA